MDVERVATRFAPDVIDAYTRAGWWGNRTFYEDLVLCAERFPEKEALVAGKRRLRYGEYRQLVDRVAAALVAHGVERWDRVAVQLPNWIEVNVLYFACAAIGAIFVPIPPNYREREVGYILEHSQACVCVIPFSF
ncbi:MAG: AMP-binding protein, partial [Clostridia bacterium]|nr:AMP-binding protein [Clostridia bacterium]